MKTVFITGASRGIGKATAQLFLDQGFFVIGTSRSGTSELSHPHLQMIPLELTHEESRAHCAQHLKNHRHQIDILINNAGGWHPADDKPTVDIAVLRDTLEMNLLGPIDLTEKLLPFIQRNGHILMLSSRRGSMTFTKDSLYPCYGISKAGLNLFTRTLAARLKGKVTVSCLHPGYVKTDMTEGEGDRTPEEAAADIYRLATSQPETGQFWYKNELFPW